MSPVESEDQKIRMAQLQRSSLTLISFSAYFTPIIQQ